ncbi:zinc finger protein 569-like [Anopheles maculipalpis]|uniref:zinc finger protein 569-like n=1 Tax=Anopheles maculipalpis TaxID=1496333 RepID=UPI002159A084|nr:zinc finger protein 569-like [Anopheles maculipalpis]
MDFFKDHPVDEEENSSQIGSVANSVCQEIPIVDECIQNSPQNIFCVANISTKALKTTEGNGEDDFYSANYISPREQSYTDNVYFGDSFVDWSCYYWPPQREPKRCQREPGKRKYHLCDVCGIMVGHMPTHALVHKPQPTYACPYCSVKMKQKSGMVQHIQTVHLKVVSKTCHLCGKTFVHRKTYVYHMRAHKDAGESFECKVCSKTFFRSIGLEVHVRKVHSIAKSV